MIELVCGIKGSKKAYHAYRDSNLINQLFLLYLLKKDKLQHAGTLVFFFLNILNWIAIVFCVVSVFILPHAESILEWSILGVPIGIFVFIAVGAPFLVPERFAHRNIQQDRALSIVLILGLLFYLLIYKF